jgi:hypothetical protein
MSPKSVGVVAWSVIGLAVLIYAPMAVEYMTQYFMPGALELYLHTISAIVSLNPDSQVGSLVHHQLPTYTNSHWIMLVCLTWSASVAFYCAVLASPVVAISMGYLLMALLRRKSTGKAPSAVGPVELEAAR